MKNKIILTAKHGRPSTLEVYASMSSGILVQRRQLFKRVGRKLIKQYYRVFKNNTRELNKETSISFLNSIVVRWGTREEIETDKTTIVYNQSKAIAIATNKKLSRETFIANNVSTPALVTPDTFREEYLPIIARPLEHSKGKNFVILNNLAQYNAHVKNHTGWYYSAFVDKVKEFRLHVAHGRILNYLEKPKPADGNIAWNRAQNGEAFENVKWDDYNTNICMEAIKAVQALELDFAGVDVMVDKDGKVFILEVNTAATLASSEYSMQRYAKYFDWLCKDAKRREHWELKEFKKATNYAWHDYHFEDRNPNK